ncbi:MAG: MazG nucleotide pyrophosphohydrolase domain-containing protein [Nanoarchaeota archaeon]
MEIKEAQKKVDELINHYGGYWNPLSQFARLVEETGELSRALNIKFGEKKSKFTGDGKEIEKEIADCAFAIIALCNYLKIDLDKELEEKIAHDWEKCKGVYDKS